jgi:hypothetical protein
MVIFKRPDFKTVLAYLKSKGWTPDANPTAFYLMKPPKEFKFDDPAFRLRIPVNPEHFEDEAAYILVRNIASMYEVKLQSLFDLFYKSLDEIKSEVEAQPRQMEEKRAMVANG